MRDDGQEASELSAVLALSLTACIVYLILPQSLKLVYTLDSAHLATAHPEGPFPSMICPNDGSTMTPIVLIEEVGIDAPWRAAFICETENIFWVVDYSGGFGKVLWYGPFDASWRVASILAAVGAFASGLALIATFATHCTPTSSTQKAESGTFLGPPRVNISWRSPTAFLV